MRCGSSCRFGAFVPVGAGAGANPTGSSRSLRPRLTATFRACARRAPLLTLGLMGMPYTAPRFHRIRGRTWRVLSPSFQDRFESARTTLMETADEQPVDFLLPGTASGLELEYPARVVPFASWLGHTPFALWLVGALKPRIVVELGVHTGNSYCAFLQAVHTLGLNTRCFGIDHWQGDAHAGHYGDEVYQELQAYHDPRYGTFSTLLRTSFEGGAALFFRGQRRSAPYRRLSYL